MIRNNTEPETNRGQVGIGTLIVFIAMVLVAAIAAGVLINTAGFLQTQAEDTGTESTQQVADNLNVITETGTVGANDAANSEIGELQLGVQPAAGADDINLAELSLQLVSDDQFANLVQSSDGDESPGSVDATPDGEDADNDAELPEYGVDLINAETEDDVVMTDTSDRYELIVETVEDPVGEGLEPFEEGTDIEVTITTEAGAQTVAFLQVPDSLTAEGEGDTVNL